MTARATRSTGTYTLGILFALASMQAVAIEDIFGSSSQGSSPASLYSVDADTGAATLIGSTGLLRQDGITQNRVSGIAIDPTDGRLYGIFGSACSGARLITIDPITGAGTPIGFLQGANFDASDDTGDGNVNVGGGCLGGSDALIFGDDGTLYAGGWNGGTPGGKLLTVNKTSGVVLSNVATTGLAHIAGLARAPGGTIWVSRGNNGPGQLHTIDTATGQFLSTLQLSDANITISDIAFGADGTLYGSVPNTGVLVTIDTVSGAVTTVGPFGGGARIAGLTLRGGEIAAQQCQNPAGCNVTGAQTVRFSEDIEIPDGGTLTQRVVTNSPALRTDPRVQNGTCGTEPLVLFDAVDDELPTLVIPPWICGTPFIVIESNASFPILNGTIVLTNEDENVFENPRICKQPLDSLQEAVNQPEVVHATTSDDPRDWPTALATTYECGSSRGRGHSFSYTVVGMGFDFGVDPDVYPHQVKLGFYALGIFKYGVLFDALRSAKEALPRRKWFKLVALASVSKGAYLIGFNDVAERKLKVFVNKVRKFDFDTSVGFNHEGNLIEKADHLRYFVDKYVDNLPH